MANGVMRGSGNTKTPLKVTFFMNCLSAALSYFLIYKIDINFLGNGEPVKGLGVVGAALGITIARIIGAIISIVILIRGKKEIRIKEWTKYKPQFGLFSEVLKLGVPYGMEQFFMQTGKLILQIIITGMGTVAIAANTIAMSIMSLCITTGYGFNLAAVTLTGQALGAKDIKRAKRNTKEVLRLNLLFMCVVGLIIFIFAPQLLSLYSNKEEVIRVGVTIVRIYALSQPFLAIIQVLTGTLRGAGDTRYPMITTFIGVWIFRLVMGYILGVLLDIGISGVWIAMSIDLILRAALYILRYRKGKWETLWSARKVNNESGSYISSIKE